MKKYYIIGILIIIFLVSNLTVCLGHESSPLYKIYIVNRFVRGGLILVTADVDIESKKLKLDYFWDQKILEVKVGEVTGDMQSINLLYTFDLECNEKAGRDKLMSRQFDIPKFKKGMILVVWVNKIESKYVTLGPLDNTYVLENVKNIQLEHDRLEAVKSYKNNDEMLTEIDRNFDE